MMPKKRKLLFKEQTFIGSVVGGGRWVMKQEGMFSFTREENDPQIGREKQKRRIKRKKQCTKCQTQILNFCGGEHFFFALI